MKASNEKNQRFDFFLLIHIFIFEPSHVQ